MVEEQEEPEGGIEFVSAPSFIAHGLLSGQPLVDFQKGVALARDSTH